MTDTERREAFEAWVRSDLMSSDPPPEILWTGTGEFSAPEAHWPDEHRFENLDDEWAPWWHGAQAGERRGLELAERGVAEGCGEGMTPEMERALDALVDEAMEVEMGDDGVPVAPSAEEAERIEGVLDRYVDTLGHKQRDAFRRWWNSRPVLLRMLNDALRAARPDAIREDIMRRAKELWPAKDISCPEEALGEMYCAVVELSQARPDAGVVEELRQDLKDADDYAEKCKRGRAAWKKKYDDLLLDRAPARVDVRRMVKTVRDRLWDFKDYNVPPTVATVTGWVERLDEALSAMQAPAPVDDEAPAPLHKRKE